MPEITGDLLRGHLENMILSVLESSDAHGLEILRRLEEAGCGFLRLKEG
ncbi:MAG: PadR family transcriptional regulator, partial [Planctomycetes bacterium]|nr:PadR family transcriptional regulator [Planctomycetota bacterium]